MNSDLDAELAEGIALVRAIRSAMARGARINNLYQVPAGWRCNVVGPTGASEFAQAAVGSEAVLAALAKLPATPEPSEDIFA